MFDKHTHTLIAQRLDQAEKQREQIRAISLDYPEITIEDAFEVRPILWPFSVRPSAIFSRTHSR
ncbi:hypothetical protein ACUOFC_56700, partial [Escherichia sp. TWPC-MK]